MRSRINFAKIVTILAVMFGVSVGSCGLMAITIDRHPVMLIFGIAGEIVMVLSVIGFIVLGLIWIVSSIFGGASHQEAGLKKLFEDEKRDRK